MNQGFNKTRGKMKSKLPLLPKRFKTKHGNRIQKGTSKKIKALTDKRNRKVEDYMHKVSRYIVDRAIEQNVTKIIIGNNKNWKQKINIGTKNNNSFCSIPHDSLIEKVRYKAQMVGMETIDRQEAYTSKCSALDLEPIQKHEKYLGKRVKRGLFVDSKGRLINADCNGSLNIARLELSASGDEINISELVVSCVSQPKKVNVLSHKTKLLECFE